jgi:hypothetical protein
MSKPNSNHLFTLIKSLSKAEKRHFKLYAKRNFGSADIKFLTLFDILDKQKEHDPEQVKRKMDAASDSALSNLRAHLYEQLLIALRLLHHNDESVRIDELISFAKVLYKKGLYMQSLEQLKKAKAMASELQFDSALYAIIEMERHIELFFVTDSGYDRAQEIVIANQQIKHLLDARNDWANLALMMYDYYLKFGHVKNRKQYEKVEEYFQEKSKSLKKEGISVQGRIYMHMANAWFHFITQNFVNCYRHSMYWISEMNQQPDLIIRIPIMYLKGIHNAMSALYYSNKPRQFMELEKQLIKFIEQSSDSFDKNTNITAEIYRHMATLNRLFMQGNFSNNESIIEEMKLWLRDHKEYLDQNRIQVFHYKIACLYFGAGDFKNSIYHLNEIINADFKEKYLKQDVQCFARILNLVAHFELGNMDLVEYQLKSTYRFLIKYGDLQKVQEEIIQFIRKSVQMKPEGINRDFIELKTHLEEIIEDPYERRPLLYLDLIGWLTSKIEGRLVEEVIRERQKGR